MRFRVVLLTITALAASAAGASAQSSAPRSFQLRAATLTTPPVIDGVVNDGEWRGAAIATDFIQFQPQRGQRASTKTVVFIALDTRYIYVAFRCWDDQPLTARLTQRDGDLLSDDSVVVVLDTADDRQTGYYFFTNPLGTQMDGRIIDDGRQTDNTWDGPWRSAAKRTDVGWSAEFAIPLSTVKYAAGKDRVWGLNLGRERRRTLEFSSWAGPLDSLARVSQAGQWAGLDLPAPPRAHQIIPYGFTRLQERTTTDWQAGLDARYSVTPQTSVYGTLNPDFATIEADVEQVNLTRFEVSLPEKRQFFLEGSELFKQRIRTFYSRRIEDILVGGKVLGKQGPWTTTFLTTWTDPITDQGRANVAVGRVQRDVFGRSSVALMVGNRRLGGLDQGSVSFHTHLFFSKLFGMTAQVVQRWGPFRKGTEAFYVRPSYDSPTGHFHVRYTHLGNRLRENLDAVGQITDDDRREIDSAVEKTFWVRSGTFEQIQYGSNYNIYWSQTGVLRSWEIDQSVGVEFRNRLSPEASYSEEFKRFEKDFRNRRVGVDLGYNTREYNSLHGGVEFGRNFDADFQLWSAGVRRKITDQLSAEYSLERLILTPDPGGENTWIHVIRANQSFTKDLFLRVFFQTNSAIDRRNLQAVFVWRYLPPFGTIQVAYQRGTAAFGQRSAQGHTLFLKATTVF
ncbi:MAG: DUF5916 domain-containing protein [Acidobacteria bacterium]|nr:DUF5916 domain-containing protein [Acidobacteriota bacterium]